MLMRLSGAVIRALLVVIVFITPAMLLPDISRTSQELALIIGIIFGGFTLFEYVSESPGFVDFRFAPPYNRLRIALLASQLIIVSILMRALESGADMFPIINGWAERAVDATHIPFGPVDIAMRAMDTASNPVVQFVFAYSFAHTLLGTLLIIFILLFFRWPVDRASFNLWVNLPAFQPMEHLQAERRLRRDALFNILFGIALFYLMPPGLDAGLKLLGQNIILYEQPLVWMAAAWTFIPASMLIRGAAILKIVRIMRIARGE